MNTREEKDSYIKQKYKPDWICDDDSCKNVNFAKRTKCNICGKNRPDNPKLMFSSEAKAANSRITRLLNSLKPGEWLCEDCEVINYTKRLDCYKCKKPKTIFVKDELVPTRSRHSRHSDYKRRPTYERSDIDNKPSNNIVNMNINYDNSGFNSEYLKTNQMYSQSNSNNNLQNIENDQIKQAKQNLELLVQIANNPEMVKQLSLLANIAQLINKK